MFTIGLVSGYVTAIVVPFVIRAVFSLFRSNRQDTLNVHTTERRQMAVKDNW